MGIPISYNLRNIAIRRTTSVVTALGIGLVVFVLSAAMMLSEGIKRTLGASGSADVAVVVRKGSDTELTSAIDPPLVGLVLAAPGVKRDASKAPMGLSEVVVVAALEKLGTDGVANVQLRGVEQGVWNFRHDARVVAGRKPRPGTDEVMVGSRIRGRFRGLEVGQKFELKRNRYAHVVGVFEASGASYESEVWADIDTLRTSFGREGLVSSIRVQLISPSKFDGFKASVESDKRLQIQAIRETEFYAKQSENTSVFVMAMGSLIAFFFSLGAIIGAAITMYGAVSTRQREVGTLRALGFSRSSILSSFLIESIILSIFGGVLGVCGALAMGAVKFSMMNFQSWSEIVFSFYPTPSILLTAVIVAMLMGTLGGLFPAIRAARISPIEAMRA